MKNKYFKALSVMIILFIMFQNANAKTIITGKLINFKGNPEADYCKPLDGFANDKEPTFIKFNNDLAFKIILNITKPGFVFLDLPNARVKLFININDSINLKAHYSNITSNNKFNLDTLKVTGSNSEGNALCNNYSHIILNQQLLSDSLFSKKTYHSVSDFFIYAVKFIDSICAPISTLYTAKKIDSIFYKHVLADIQSTLVVDISIFFNVLVANKNKSLQGNLITPVQLNKNLFTDENFDSLRLLIYKRYNPSDTLLSSSPLGIFLSNYYYTDIYKELIKTDINYDSSFLFLDDEHKPFGFMHGRILEALWYNSLYWSGAAGTDDETTNKSFKMFVQHFPHSPFIPYLKERLGITAEDKQYENSKEDNQLVYLNTDNVLTFNGIIKNNFKGDYVFVDLWATWCVPCVEEFAYKNKLHTFLQSKNIKALYISINDTADKSNWKEYVDAKQLSGYHLLASEQLVADIKNIIYKKSDIAIPRYLLINKSGEIINDNLPRPSDFENLEKTINKLIKQ